MTGAAWLMLAVTWTVILFFTIKFFLMVLAKPHQPGDEDHTIDGVLRKDA